MSAVEAKAFMCSFIASVRVGGECGHWFCRRKKKKRLEKYVEKSNTEQGFLQDESVSDVTQAM